MNVHSFSMAVFAIKSIDSDAIACLSVWNVAAVSMAIWFMKPKLECIQRKQITIWNRVWSHFIFSSISPGFLLHQYHHCSAPLIYNQIFTRIKTSYFVYDFKSSLLFFDLSAKIQMAIQSVRLYNENDCHEFTIATVKNWLRCFGWAFFVQHGKSNMYYPARFNPIVLLKFVWLRDLMEILKTIERK